MAVKTCLFRSWSETPKTCFLATQLILFCAILHQGSKDIQALMLDELRDELGNSEITNNKGVTVIKYKQKNSKLVTQTCERILEERLRTS